MLDTVPLFDQMRLLNALLCSLAFLMIQSSRGADDLANFSDEFNFGPTLTNWHRIHEVEGWGNDVLERFDINATSPGRMFMMPYSSSWYEEFRGELTFKEVSGDFVITTDVEPSRRNGGGAPQSEYSLAGIMIRSPRTMTSPSEWTPNGQNYVFLSLGAASNPGQYQFEVKTTTNSVSTLQISGNAPPRALIQVARLGPHIIALQRSLTSAWQVHRRYFRPDFPNQMQAGLTVYTDWPLCLGVGFQNQNTTVLSNGAALPSGGVVTGANPDLQASFDFVRFRRPQIPPNLLGADFSNPAAVSDAQLLSFLGTNASAPFVPAPQLAINTPSQLRLRAQAGLASGVQWSTNLQHWNTLTNLPGSGSEVLVNDPTASQQQLFYRAFATE